MIILAALITLPLIIPAFAGKSAEKKSAGADEKAVVKTVIECTRCRSQIPAGSLFCTYCGSEVVVQKTRFCWHCGIDFPPESRFCARCGSNVQQTGGDSPPAPPPDTPATGGPGQFPSIEPAVLPESGIDPADSQGIQPPAITEEPDIYVSNFPLPVIPPQNPMVGSPESEIPEGLDAGPASLGIPRAYLLPTRLFNTPTAEILPSLNVHLGSGWTFGFSGEESRNRWVMSVGLGGVSEVILASQRIDHIMVPKSNALAGFRLKLPVGWMGDAVSKHLMLAANIASTRDNEFSAPSGFPATNGVSVSSLKYDYRETTVGVVSTWKGGPLRLHGAVHITDLRTENAHYALDDQVFEIDDSKNIRPTFGFGIDYRINRQTFFMAEARSIPKVTFSTDQDRFDLKSTPEYAAGVRFFPAPPIALDALVSMDGETEGPADVEIGIGLGLLFGLPGSDEDAWSGEEVDILNRSE